MNLNDLLESPVQSLTDEELEARLYLLKRLKLKVGGKPKVYKSNKDKSINDMLKGLSPEQITNLLKLVKEE